MTEIKEFDSVVIQSKLTFRIFLEFKKHWVNWEIEVEVVRTEEENYINHEFNIITSEDIPDLSENDKKELFQHAQDKVDALVSSGQI